MCVFSTFLSSCAPSLEVAGLPCRLGTCPLQPLSHILFPIPIISSLLCLAQSLIISHTIHPSLSLSQVIPFLNTLLFHTPYCTPPSNPIVHLIFSQIGPSYWVCSLLVCSIVLFLCFHPFSLNSLLPTDQTRS